MCVVCVRLVRGFSRSKREENETKKNVRGGGGRLLAGSFTHEYIRGGQLCVSSFFLYNLTVSLSLSSNEKKERKENIMS